METNSVHQEILLIKNTSFTQRQLFDKDALENLQGLPHSELLESACWNGWLHAILPGIVDTSTAGKSLFLWEIMQARSFLNIELCEYPQTIDVQFSINPYAVLATVCYE